MTEKSYTTRRCAVQYHRR